MSTRAPPANWTAGYVRVKNATAALQALAFDVRRRFEGPVVGITGSVGKTAARIHVAALQRRREEKRRSERQGSFNNHVGLRADDGCARARARARVEVLEMGMSAPGEIAALARDREAERPRRHERRARAPGGRRRCRRAWRESA